MENIINKDVTPSSFKGKDTILLIEDEEVLCRLMKEELEEQGYSVITSGDGEEAVQMYAKQYTAIDIVLSDLGLPTLDGLAVFKKMKKINPHVKTIVVSGFMEQNEKELLLQEGIKECFSKPYCVSEIIQSIRTLLGA